MKQVTRRLLVLCFAAMLALPLAACGGGGGGGDGADDDGINQWDVMNWNEGQWQ